MKRSFKALALTFFIILSAALIAIGTSAAPIPGDVNGDGEVNIRDAAAILQHITGHDVQLVAPCTHSGYVVIDPAVAPTYDKSGLTAGVSCTKCGEKLLKQETLPALGHEHTEAALPAVAPTCQKEGLTEGRYCTVCNMVLVEQGTVPKVDHELGDWVAYGSYTVRKCIKDENCDVALRVTSVTATYNGIRLLTGEQVWKNDVTVTVTLSDNTSFETKDFTLENDVMTVDGNNVVTVRFVNTTTTITVPAIHDNLPGTSSISDFEYTGADKDAITITKYIGTSAEVVIPAHIDRVPVRYIGNSAFSENKGIQSITIPGSIKTIERAAFYNCTGLKTLNLNEGLEVIKGQSFMYCPITTLVIPDSVNTIEVYYPSYQTWHGAFEGCKNLTEVVIGDGLTSIARETFYGCSSLKTLVIGDSVATIGEYAFGGCSGLTDITMGENLHTIGNYAFYNCTSLKTLNIGSAVQSIGSGAFSGCTMLKEINFSDSVTTINSFAFENCTSLASINIPGNVQTIYEGAFYGCSGLRTLILNEGLNTIKGQAFMGCPITSLVIPDSVNTIEVYYPSYQTWHGAFEGCKNLTEVVIGNGLTSIARETFNGCSALKSLTIGNGVATIGEYAFNGCSGLNNIIMGTNLNTIGNYAFSGCTSLKVLNIGSAVQSIGSGAFSGCTMLKEINFSDSVTTINSFAFENCTALASVNIPGNVQTICEGAFYGCSGLRTLSLNEGLNTIKGQAFMGCPITSLVIPDSVNTIDVYYPSYQTWHGAFENCKNLTSVVIGDGLISIARETFQGCSALKTLNIGDAVSTIGEYAFSGCSGLNDIVMGENLHTIGSYAFYNCTSLKTLNIGSAVQNIGSGAFSGCTMLKEINFSDSVTTINSFAFENCAALASVNIPGNVQTICEGAFYGCSGLKTLILNEGLNTIKGQAFMGCPITSLVIPDSVNTIEVYYPSYQTWHGAFENCKNLTSVVIGDGLISIARETFQGCSALKTLDIGDGVATIGEYAFNGCSGLTDITMGDNLHTIGSYAFYNCASLKTLNIGSAVQNIGSYSFGECKLLSEINFSDSVTAIGDFAFTNCSTLAAVNIPGNVQTIGAGAFYGCSGLQSVILNEGLTTIKGQSFMGCPITSIVIPDSVNTIEVYYPSYQTWHGAFEGCKNLTSIVIGDGLTSIERETFQNCSALENVVIGSSVHTISDYAFANCTALVSINIPDNVTTIGSYAFQGCTLLENFSLGTGVQSIGASALQDCTSIDTITIPSNVQVIGNNAFKNCSELDETVIEKGVLREIGSNVYSGCPNFDRIYYSGTESDWELITVNATNPYPLTETPYYYSATSPTVTGNFWYYNTNGDIRVWDVAKTSFKAEEYSESFANSFFGTADSSYSSQLLSELKSDALLQAGIAIWEGLNTITDFDAKKITKKEVYKLVIYDLLMGEVGSNVNPLACMEEACGSYLVEYASFMLETDVDDLAALKYLDPAKYSNAEFINKFFKGVEGAEAVFKTASNLYDALYTCAQYQALSDMDKNFNLVLNEIAKNSSLPSDLRNAARDCASCYQNASAAMLAQVFAQEFAGSTMNDLWVEFAEVAWETVITSIFPYYKVVELGVKGVMFLANAGFNLDARNEAYYQLEAAVGLENALRQVIKNTLPDYLRSNYKDNSEYYMYAIEMYQTSVLLGFDYSNDLLEEHSKGLDVNAAERQEYQNTMSEVSQMKQSRKTTYNNFDSNIEGLFTEYYA